jgi:hypothetical protein
MGVRFDGRVDHTAPATLANSTRDLIARVNGESMSGKMKWVLLAWVAMSACTVTAADSPKTGGSAEHPALAGVVAPWRDYLVAAREADRIEDPLARCLAFPDPPNVQWPTGHSEAFCRYRFAKVMSLADIEALIERDELDGIDDKVEALLETHFTKDDGSEDIHVFYRQFESPSEQANRVSARWLSAAPKSPYAMLARGMYLREQAWKARGDKWASETSADRMRRKSEIVAEAVPLLRASYKREPRLMPAYAGLLNLGVIESRDDWVKEAIDAGTKRDPGCYDLMYQRMFSMKPRWGGSYEAMLAYANEMAPKIPQRPLLAASQAIPFADRGDFLLNNDQYTREAREVLDLAVAAGVDAEAFYDAADEALNRKGADSDPWKALAMLLQETRFRKTDAWGHRLVIGVLVREDPEWSIRHGLRAVELDAGNARGQYLLAAAYNNSKRLVDADRHYVIAMQDAEYRRDSLREIAGMWLQAEGLSDRERAAKAGPHIERLVAEYPEDGRGWMMRVLHMFASGGPINTGMVQGFIRRVDAGDPVQTRMRDELLREFKKMGIKLD